MFSDLIDEFPPDMREPMYRLMDRVIDRMSDSPTTVDFQRLESLVEKQGESILELSRAQKRTEESVKELAQAQKRTEERMDELVQAQIKTEKRLTRLEVVVNRLVGEMKTVRKEVGGLSHAVVYRLEDEAIWTLPHLLPRDHSVEVQGQLRRGFLTLSGGKAVEVNIYGQGIRTGRPITIVGEAKTQLKKKDVDNFLSLIKLVSLSTDQPVFPLLVTYHTSPPVEEYARDKGVPV